MQRWLSLSVLARRKQRVNALRYRDRMLQELAEQGAEHQLWVLLLCIVEVEVEVRRHHTSVTVAVLQQVLDDC